MKHLGDITKIDGTKIEPVWAISFGAPCQDLSVAGKRAGMQHTEMGDEETTRSGLFYEAVRIIKEMRSIEHRIDGSDDVVRYPRYAIYENVPGAFSSNNGNDFKAVLESLIRVVEPQAPDLAVPDKGWPTAGCLRDVDGRWSLSWRVHDGQYWGRTVVSPAGDVVRRGTPQRRRRISVVADFNGDSAFAVQFEPQSLHRDTASRGKEGESPSGDSADGSHSADGESNRPAYTLQMRAGKDGGGKGALIQNDLSAPLLTGSQQTLFALEGNGSRPSHFGDGYAESETEYTLNATEVHGIAYGIGSYFSNAWMSDNPHSGVYEADTAKTLDAINCGYPACNQGGMAIVEPDGVVGTLCAKGYPDKLTHEDVMQGLYPVVRESVNWDGGTTAPTLTASNANGAQRMPDKESFNCVLERK